MKPNRRPVRAPQDLLEATRKRTFRAKNAGKRVAPENERAVKRAAEYMLRKAPDGVDGSRNHTAYKIAARLFDFGVTQETALSLMYDWNYNRCFPPLDDDEIERTVRSSGVSRERPIGCDNEEAPGFDKEEIDESKNPNVKQETKPSRLAYITRDESAERATTQTVEPLIDGLLTCGTMSVLYGKPGSGKSFVKMDMSQHIASGEAWCGLEVKQGPTVYVAAEGGAGIHKRCAALKQHHGGDNVPMAIIASPVDLRRSDADVKPLIDVIKEIGEKFGAPAVHVTIDTLSRALAGGDENSPVDMGAFVKNCDRVRDETKAHLSLVHHCGKDEARGARGHSLLLAAVDTEIEVSNGKITVTKQRDLDDNMEFKFRLKPTRVGWTDKGKEVISCYVELRARAEPDFERAALSNGSEQLYTAIKAALKIKNQKQFTTEFAIECENTTGCQLASAKPSAVRERVRKACQEMTEAGWIGKTKKGQWFIKDANDANDANIV